MPCEGIVTSLYGGRVNPLGSDEQFHDGIDIGVSENTEIAAVNDGTVTGCVNSDTYGIKLEFKTDDGYDVFYAHLNKILVKEGDIIKKGQIVALSGNTGETTGPHLHFGVHKDGKSIDPAELEYINY